LEQKTKWAADLRTCGARYPDFALAVLAPMIRTVADPQKQDALWQDAFATFRNRADLAATVKMEEARLWEEQKQTAKAGACYSEVIERYVNAGPFVLAALEGAERLLRDSGKADRVPLLYENAWKKCQRPEDMAGVFVTQSNWFRVGRLLAERLRDTDQTQRAAAVEGQLMGAVGAK
jgi:hypothetical protein